MDENKNLNNDGTDQKSEPSPNKKGQEINFTASEVDAKISKALETNAKKLEEKFANEKTDAINEALKKFKEEQEMTAEELAKKQIEEERKNLEAEKNKLQLQLKTAEAEAKLIEAGLDKNLANVVVVSDDVDNTIAILKKQLDEKLAAIEEANKKANAPTPGFSSTNKTSGNPFAN